MKRLNDSSDVPEARLGFLPETFTSSKKETRLHSTSPRRNGYSWLRQQKEPEEREFVVDSGASMQMVRKKDLISAELETMRTSRNPTTVMTANGEVQTRQEATVYADRTPTHKTHPCITGCSQARTAQLMRLAQELHCHLCAPKRVLSSGVTHVSSMVVLSRAFLHEHFLFFTYLSYHTPRTLSASRTSPSSLSRQVAPSRITLA